MLLHKKFDCNDGLFKVNVYWEQMGHAIIMLRYYDELNYYALEMNSYGKKRVSLVKKTEGMGSVVKDTDVFF